MKKQISILAVLALLLGLTALAVPVASSAATCATTGWSADYFNNQTLGGTPALSRCDAAINFEWWGSTSPAPAITNGDSFSTRWTQTATFAAGDYTFTATGDDGIRMFLDGAIVLNGWKNQGSTTYTGTKTLTAGSHTMVVEYYEAGGDAIAKFSYAATTTPPPPTTCTGTDWTASYFTNKTLTGTPALSRCDAAINFSWGAGSPDPSIPNDNFSARWSRSINFTAGNYDFTITGDDGIRMLLDGTTILNGWKDQGATTYAATQPVTAGTHTLTVEYYEAGGDAVAKASYSASATGGGTGCTDTTAWAASFFNNKILSGAPVLTRCDTTINNQWWEGSPDPTVNTDNFSARWTKTVNFAAGSYDFTMTGDDGIRLLVDGVNVLDGWKDQGPTTYKLTKTLTAGNHVLTVEYYEAGGGATAQFSYIPTPGGGGGGNLASTGRWTISSFTLPARAIHTTLLQDGRLLLMAGSGNDSTNFAAGTFTSKVWDPVTNAVTDIPTPYDMFCAGHVTLADGRVLIMGGTSTFPGVNGTNFQGSHKSYIFDPKQMKFLPVNDTNEGHWYPTPIKLGNGDVEMVGGLGDGGGDPNAVTVATTDERFVVAQNKWLSTTDPANPQTSNYWGEYPHMFLMADGRIFYDGAHVFGDQLPFGSGADIWDINAKTITDVPGLPNKDDRDQAGSVLLPPAQNQTVLIAGGGHTKFYTPPTATTATVNLNDASPHYTQGPDLPGGGRQYLNLTTMFDRTVLASDGSTGVRTDNVFQASIYNPATNTWTTDTPPDPVGRNYHSSTQLLPDGRVIAMGSNPVDNSFEIQVSIYEPPYLFKGTRPTVSAASVLGYGTTQALTVSSDVVNASLTTLGSTTHQMDSNARLVDLPITGTGTTRTATVPSNHNLLTPGPYMLTVMNGNGVPSLAKIVMVQ